MYTFFCLRSIAHRTLLTLGAFLLILCTQAQDIRPKIGLTLSGGGAKGLAHVGILKAIDSAGLKIDMVTGTSMGSIIGALYAVGYSGKDIEKIARKLDWSSMFSNRPPISMVNMNEKREFGNYALEVPFENGKARFYTGLIEAEEIWLTFGELFYPVHNVKDFSKFSIPFRCVATDVATGKPVIFKEGEIVKAIRASMAIPSIFSAVPYNDTKLVDGGVVRNFPVRDAKSMGADYVIGVLLSPPLMPADKLNSAIDILYQIGFYKDAEDFIQERKLTNLLIEPPLDNFSAASFDQVDSLLWIGNEMGRKYYPHFKKIADSLRARYPDAVPLADRLPKTDKVVIDEITATGLKTINMKDFTGKLGLETGKAAGARELSMAARKAFATGSFRRLAYFVEPTAENHAKLNCEALENAPTTLKVGLHFHSYTDVALITTLAKRNLLFNRSKTFVKVNWSSNFRFLARYDQSFGRRERWGSLISFYHENFRFPLYSDYEQVADYKSDYTNLDFRLYRLLGTKAMVGAGIMHEWLGLTPKLSPTAEFRGTNDYWNAYVYYQQNTLDLKVFPREGSYVDIQAGIVFNQRPDYTFISEGIGFSSDTLNVNFHSYEQLKVKAGRYFALNNKWTLMAQVNSGINFNYQQAFLNFYSVGGINDFIRNQIPFVGLTENQGNTRSIAAFLAGVQFEPYPNLLATVRGNVGLIDFLDKQLDQLTTGNLLSGYGLSAGYRSPIGPFEITLMYNDKTNQFKGYVNMGFTF